MKLTKEDRKFLIEVYPYLQPRNVWTDKIPDDYDYEYVRGERELPEGWFSLFLQMCEDISYPLAEAGYLDKFRFSQIKEKYNTMRCYNFGVPEEVHNIITKYEVMSRYICTKCGRPAVYETQGWYVESFCEDCWKDIVRHEEVERLEPTFEYTRSIYSNGVETKEKVLFKEEWDRYLKNIDTKFLKIPKTKEE